MNEKQREWFKKLAQKRKEFAILSQDPDYKGMWEVLIKGIYSDDAHFVYELLQNAEDVKATSVRFILKENGLYFIHNGTIAFTITDIEKPNENGHINAITAVGRTGKKISETIGKFGIGFKAIFQYTKIPYIYDPTFKFKIYDYIIPELLNDDNIDVLYDKSKETVFYFPFISESELTDNNKVKSKTEAYKDISNKLRDLDKPTLFLSNLREITWEIGNEKNIYKKEINETVVSEDIKFERIRLIPNSESFLIFTRFHKEEIMGINLEYSYSTGFKVEENNLEPITNSCAYCFFTTTQNTNVNFIFHAPFLLNSNRESIPRNQNLKIKDDADIERIIKPNFNEFLIEQLAQLSADSLLILKELKLIDDEIINIIPYKKPVENDFFAPFYYAIKEKFETEEILPAKDKDYAKKENAYWAVSPDLTVLFSNKQLSSLVGEENAKWVFPSISRTESTEIRDYIDGGSDRTWERRDPNLIKANLDFENKITNLITADFIREQSNDWLHKFYEYLSERKSYQDKFKTKAIFKDTNGNPVPAFEQNGKELHPILFLPSEYSGSSYIHIHPALLENDKSKEFIQHFGIKIPSLKDEIYNNILPQYRNDEEIDTETHFLKFFKFFKDECSQNEMPSFIELIKDKEFVSYKTKDENKTYRGKANEIYYPYAILLKYFESTPDTKFLDLDDYYSFISENDRDQLKTFLLKIGLNVLPRLLMLEITDAEEKRKLNLEESTYGYNDRQTTKDKTIDGCQNLLKNINEEKSKLLWKILLKLVQVHSDNVSTFERKLFGEHYYYYYKKQFQMFESSVLRLIKSSKWLIDLSGEFVSPRQITINELSDGYEMDNIQKKQLIELLKFKPLVILTEEEEKLKFLEENDIDLDELKEYKEWKENRNTLRSNSNGSNSNNDTEAVDQTESSKLDRTIKDLESLQKEYKPKTNIIKRENLEDETILKINFNEDEEYEKGIEDLKERLEIRRSRVNLTEGINNSTKYSYDWFEAYLELLTTYGEKQEPTKQKSISFQEIKPYKQDNKYFLLCGASSYISPEIESAEDFKVSFVFGSGKKENIIVEGVSKKGQDLLIYCRESLPVNILSRFSDIFKVEINFTPVIDLLERLYKAFTNSNYIDKWDKIIDSMPSLKYIYGPPGTGKTTTLCNNINQILDSNPKAKFLVLTPTNKAADVVCKKLKEVNDFVYAIRLSRPTDPELDESIYRDSIDEKDMESINVVASTIHRLPYFDIQNIGLLFQYKWDYVIFDESSMTGLHYITFAIMALFKTNPNTIFFIAGDPKQIPPVIGITDSDLENFDFQDENIYKMMSLESFNPEEQVVRDIDNIENLDIQYRSIPCIGQLFSELSYSGLLKHDRATNNKESKPLPEKFKDLISSNVTFIDIPIDKDNSIYKVNRLLYSSYHTYCAILVSEIIKYFDSVNNDSNWTIGLIAPYKAQAILLNKLITSYGISEKVKVYSDTVHGFQGDECDIVFFVCNPNNYKYSGNRNALLSKEYIYNVAISRAKDYLVILHPYTAIRDNKYVNEISISYKNNFGNARILDSKEIERTLFQDENYIENNSYVSGHDSVNVFGLSDMKYFIKLNDTAIDIQLRDLK